MSRNLVAAIGLIALAFACSESKDRDAAASYCTWLCDGPARECGSPLEGCVSRCARTLSAVPAPCARAFDALADCIGMDSDRRVECRPDGVAVGPAEGTCTTELDALDEACP